MSPRPVRLVCLLLALVLGLPALLPAAPARAGYPLPAPAGSPVVSTANSRPQLDDPALHDLVERIVDRAPGEYSVVVISLVDGRRASVNATRELEAASVYKLFVMYEVYRQQRLGLLDLDMSLIVTARAASESLGMAVPPAGSSITVREALERMVQLSDNTCAVLLGDLVGWSRMRDDLREIGIRHTEFWPDVTTTAEDVAHLLWLIAVDEAVDQASSVEMVEVMLGQRWNDRLPLGLPPDAAIAHKTGDLPGITHDAGIVVAPFGRYVIVVLSQDGSRPAFAELARQVHAYLGTKAMGFY